jgi:ABC-2 type transport system ATP-binding protein
VVKRFESTCALDGVGLRVEEGEVHGLLGPNGAGKTTLLRLLFGLIAPDAGAIEVFGAALRGPGSPPVDGVSGFVEDPSVYPYLSGRANLELLAELDGGSAASRVDRVLDQVGPAQRSSDRVSGYSTGMRQRLGIAASLLGAPRLLLLDEPTSGLDPAGVREIRSLVRGLSAAGIAVLISSHLIGDVEEVCHGFTILCRGHVVWNGTAAELRAQAPGSGYPLWTSHDQRALELAASHPGVHAGADPNGGLSVTVDGQQLDSYVLALGQAGVAVRRLELVVSPLEAMFFALTGEDERVQSDPVRAVL